MSVLVGEPGLAVDPAAGSLVPSGSSGAVGVDAVAAGPDRTVGAGADPRRARFLRPGWPLAVLFVPFPLWWAMGLQEWIFLIMAVPMGLYLIGRRDVLVPKSFGFWLFFLAWVIGGAVVLQVDAYGAVADDNSTRFVTWTYRLLWYLAVTIAGLYVLNTRDTLSTRRVARIMSAMFLTIVAGGILGLVAPRFEFPSVLEMILPGGLANQQFVYKMIHPTAAQTMEVLGYESPRPSAPFFFTNTWGLNIAVFLPFFLLGWTGKDSGWRRALSPVVLVLAAIAIVMSINRGLWLALAAMGLFMALRSAFMGRPGVLAMLGAGVAVVALLVTYSPLGGVVQARLSNEGSEQGRTNLGTLTVTSVAKTAPISGLGSTRNVQGNFNTIAGGATADCPRCSPPALGTQGQLWLVVYSQGVVGVLLYLAFFGLIFLRYLRDRSPEASLGLAVVVASTVTMPFYNSLGCGLFAVMVAVGLMAREGAAPWQGLPHYRSGRAQALRPLDGYLHPLFAYWPVVAGTLVLGLVGGFVWQGNFGTSAKATATVILPEQPRYQDTLVGQRTLDSVAQLLYSDPVLKATATAARTTPDLARSALQLVVQPTTRIARITYVDPVDEVASAGATAAATALIAERGSAMELARTTELANLTKQAAGLDLAIRTLDATLVTVQGGTRPSKQAPLSATAALRKHRTELLTQVSVVNGQVARVLGANLVAGTTVDATSVTRNEDPWRISMLSGALLGLLAGAAGATAMYRRRRRVLQGRHVLRDTGLVVLSRPDHQRRLLPGRSGRSAATRAVTAVTPLARSWPGVTFMAADAQDADCLKVATELNRRAPELGTSTPSVVIVTTPGTRITDLVAARDRCERWGSPVAGVVIA